MNFYTIRFLIALLRHILKLKFFKNTVKKIKLYIKLYIKLCVKSAKYTISIISK